MSTGTGVNVSRALIYEVIRPLAGEFVSKALVYEVIKPINISPPEWPAFTFANGIVGVPYSQDFDLVPAANPTIYSVISGALPDGLALSNIANDVGRISGTPTTAGTYNFSLRATNIYGTVDKVFSIIISTTSGSGGGSYVWIS